MYSVARRSGRPRLEIVAAVAMVVAAFMPFASWAYNFGGLGYDFSFSISLTSLLNLDAAPLGALLVWAGGLTAFITAVYRAANAWPGSQSAGLGLVGFVVLGLGVLVAMAEIGGGGSFLGASGTALSYGFTPSIGFWAELGVAVAGAFICIFNLARPVHSPYLAGMPQYGFGGPGGWYGAPTPGWQAPMGQPGWPPTAQQFGAPQFGQQFGAPQYWPGQPASPQFGAGPTAPVSQAAPAGPLTARLTVTNGVTSSSSAVADGQTVVVGSDPGADVVVSDPASPRQLSLTVTSAGWTIQPLDPANQAHLTDSAGMTGMLHGPATIVAGQLQIGSTRLVLEPPTAV